jgi:hypothetical protein
MTSPKPDPLEAELSAMQAVELSPALRRRIGQALAQPVRPRSRRVLLSPVALLVGAAAACIAIAGWVAVHHHQEQSGKTLIVQQVEGLRPNLIPTDAATLADYRRAIAESPARLDALLDAQAAITMRPGDPVSLAISTAGNHNWIP